MPLDVGVEQFVGVEFGAVAGHQMQFDPVGILGPPGVDGLAAVDRVPVGDHVDLASGLGGEPVQEAGEHLRGEAAGEDGEPQRAI